VVAARRWRYYRTEAGRCPVKEFIDAQPAADQASIFAGLREVAHDGLIAARHLSREIYEVRADGDRQTYRILFAVEARRGQVLLALEAFSKKTPKTPPARISVAQRRLTDWHQRATRRSQS
jgi:phage-related protein